MECFAHESSRDPCTKKGVLDGTMRTPNALPALPTLSRGMPMPLAIITILIPLVTASGEEISIGTVYGTVKTLYSTINGFIGATEVVPAVALNNWRRDWWGVYGNIAFEARHRVTRSLITGQYHYQTIERQTILNSQEIIQSIEHKQPFNLSQICRWNYRCDLSSINQDGTVNHHVYNGFETFSLAVWAASVRKTGYFPPSGPFVGWIKHSRTEISPNCNPSPGRIYSALYSYSIGESGTSTVTPIWINFDYSWPPRSWIGEPYDG